MEIWKRGSRGATVKQIQKALNLYQDGIFGRLTEEAVINFQKEHGLKADGIVDPATLSKLLVQSFTLKKSKRRIDEIIIHCSATIEGKDYTVSDIRNWHKDRGFSDIGYHYVIYRDGSRHYGRDVDLSGAHVENRNSHSIGICYIGGLDKNKKAKDTRTEEQKAALLSLLVELRKLYPKAKILGHRDCSPDKNHNGVIEPWEWMKECPSFDAQKEYSRI